MATTYDVLFRISGGDPSTTAQRHDEGPAGPSDADEGDWSLVPDPAHPGRLSLKVTVLADDASLAEVRGRELAPGLLRDAGLDGAAVTIEDVEVRVPS